MLGVWIYQSVRRHSIEKLDGGILVNVLDKGYVILEDKMGGDNTVVDSARVSHLAESKGVEKDTTLINYLIKNKHTSPFEHVVFQFLIKCPIFVARQWMRHRTWSFNEVSRRYTSEDIDFYIPSHLRLQSNTNKQSSLSLAEGMIPLPVEKTLVTVIKNQVNSAYSEYNYLLSLGVSREQARMILPQNTYTTFYGTVNLHNLFHFLELRNSPAAQEEIRVYAQTIEKIIEPFVPISFNAWKENLNEHWR